jgi:hypothetical protein
VRSGTTNWPPPRYDPQTELFYLNGTDGYGIAYLYDTSSQPQGYGGGGGTFDGRSALFALDIRNRGDSGNLVAFDPQTARLLGISH